MLPHPDRYDENAFRSSGWATRYWMKFFATLRMTAKNNRASLGRCKRRLIHRNRRTIAPRERCF